VEKLLLNVATFILLWRGNETSHGYSVNGCGVALFVVSSIVQCCPICSIVPLAQ